MEKDYEKITLRNKKWSVSFYAHAHRERKKNDGIKRLVNKTDIRLPLELYFSTSISEKKYWQMSENKTLYRARENYRVRKFVSHRN